jgi:hypothetical protein
MSLCAWARRRSLPSTPRHPSSLEPHGALVSYTPIVAGPLWNAAAMRPCSAGAPSSRGPLGGNWVMVGAMRRNRRLHHGDRHTRAHHGWNALQRYVGMPRPPTGLGRPSREAVHWPCHRFTRATDQAAVCAVSWVARQVSARAKWVMKIPFQFSIVYLNQFELSKFISIWIRVQNPWY